MNASVQTKVLSVAVKIQPHLRVRVAIVFPIILFLAFMAGSTIGQSPKCDPDRGDSVKYRIAQNFKSNLPPYIRSLRIVVKPENFNRGYMTLLARSIHQRFCTDEEISAVIFDDKHVADTMDMGLFLTGRIKIPEVRGFYALTSHTLSGKGKDHSIEYSTKRGNPTNEVVIDLPPD